MVSSATFAPLISSSPQGSTEKKGGLTDVDLGRWQAGGITSFYKTCFAEYWDGLPSIVAVDDGDVVVEVDPYDFLYRMAMQKYIIENTGGERIWGSGCSKHPIWGYAAQLDWQHRSGRLEDPSSWQDGVPPTKTAKKTNKISKQSWWGYMNLNFSVASYGGAVEAGLVPAISFSDESVLNDVGYQSCVGHWKDFWENAYLVFLASHPCSQDEEWRSTMTMYRALWKTHTGIIKTSLQHAKDLEDVLPKEDRGVGLGWSNMVELLAATNWPLLSLDSLYKFGGGYLPSVRLAGPEALQWLKANRKMEYTTATNLHQLMDIPEKMMNLTCRFFARVSRWGFAVRNLPRTLHVLTHGNAIQKSLASVRVVALALCPGSVVEIGVAVFAFSMLAMRSRLWR